MASLLGNPEGQEDAINFAIDALKMHIDHRKTIIRICAVMQENPDMCPWSRAGDCHLENAAQFLEEEAVRRKAKRRRVGWCS